VSLEHSPGRTGGPSSQIARRALSINEFCRAHGISRAMFYKLEKQGLAPRVMHVGSRRLISDEAGAEWRRRMENQAEAM
jgi:predicted DNA-binding transcriptional regulator AlpA